MITIGSNGQNIAYGIKHYNMDSMDDLAKLNPKAELMGTTCFIINTSKYYMVNGEKEWVEIAPYGNFTSSNGSGGSNNNPSNPGGGSNNPSNPDDGGNNNPSNPDNNNPSNPDGGGDNPSNPDEENGDIYDGGEI